VDFGVEFSCNRLGPSVIQSFIELASWRIGMAAAPQFRIDVDARNLLLHSLERARPAASTAAAGKRITLPEPIFPQCPEKLTDPDPVSVTSPETRSWSLPLLYPALRGSSFPNIQSKPFPGDFHPASAYSFVEYKCNLNW
jgi:hypothetical protein